MKKILISNAIFLLLALSLFFHMYVSSEKNKVLNFFNDIGVSVTDVKFHNDILIASVLDIDDENKMIDRISDNLIDFVPNENSSDTLSGQYFIVINSSVWTILLSPPGSDSTRRVICNKLSFLDKKSSMRKSPDNTH